MFYFFLSGLLACTSSSDFDLTEASTEMSVDLNKAVLYPTSACTLLVEEIENGEEVILDSSASNFEFSPIVIIHGYSIKVSIL